VTAACSSWTPALVSDSGTCPPGQFCCRNATTTTISTTTTTASPRYSITGKVFIDNNTNGVYEAGETYTEVIDDGIYNEFSNGDPHIGPNLIKVSVFGGGYKYAIDTNGNGVYNSGEPFITDFGTRTTSDYPIYYKDPATNNFIKFDSTAPFVTTRDYYIDINRDGVITESGIAHEPFTDLNANGVWDEVIDVPYVGGTSVLVQRAVSLTTYGSSITDSFGNYGVNNLPSGNYLATLTVPAGYSLLGGISNPASVSLSLLSGNATVNFPLAPSYATTGYVFVDNNANGVKDAGESCYSGGLSVKLTPDGGGNDVLQSFTSTGTTTCNTFNVSRSEHCGTLTLTGLGAGYKIVALNFKDDRPENSVLTPMLNSSSVYVCGSEVNFGVSNSAPWIQTIDADIRMDSGFDDPIPSGASCGTSIGSYASMIGTGGTPGIIF